jgi:UDP-2,3-diacylglucosamine hydrolase
MRQSVYFASDFHLGIPDHDQSLVREKMLVEWLEMIRKDASEIFLMGDLFDFWFEYHSTVPRGYVRLFGKLAEITDSGIPVHLFRGNHDMWAFDYLSKEMNIVIHRDPEIRKFGEKIFYLAHGDGLGPGDHGYKFIKKVFQCRFNQWLFRWIHPDFGMKLGLFWSRQSRYANLAKTDRAEIDREIIHTRLTVHSRNILESNPGINYFIYGHWHLPLTVELNPSCIQVSLGDWLTNFTFARFDGHELSLEKFGVKG